MAGGRQALYYIAFSRYASLLIQIATTVVIARLLSPSEIGIYSVGAAFVALGHLLRDFGSGTYLIQEKELTVDRIRAAFSVTLLLSWLVALITNLIGPIAAQFYDQIGLEDILTLLSLNFLLLPFGSITLAYAQRELNFLPSSVASISSAASSSAVSIYLAYAGHSYMSLVWGSISGTITTVVIASLLRPKSLPFIWPGIKGIRKVFTFGSRISLIWTLGKFASAVPELVLGKTQGFHEVGLFSRTQGTANLFSQVVMMVVNPIIAPLFAERIRSGGSIRPLYLHGLTCVTGLAWAFSINLAVLADPLVLVLYGDQWKSIVPLVQIWSLSLVLGYLTSLVDQVLIGTGNIDRLLRYSILINAYQIGGFAITGFISLEAVLIVVVFAPVLRFFWLWHDIKRICEINLSDLMHTARLSMTPAVSSGAIASLAVYLLNSISITHPLAQLLIGTFASGVTWLLLIWRSKHPLWGEARQAFHNLRS